jgi:nucleotidyltransferase AbiEii toxin of type IV toxin-antitoxin system
MPTAFTPRLNVLPGAQRRLWAELAQTPEHFTLYGGTAIALRLGHRQSADFDFFSPRLFEPRLLLETISYLKGAEILRSAANDLTVTVDRDGPVQLSFFGNFDLGQVAPAEPVQGPQFNVAALLDVAGMKVAVVTQRAEPKDYLDIHALLTKANISLATMLAAAAIIYGSEFNPLLSLKAISYFGDRSLGDLPPDLRRDLIEAVRTTDPHNRPVIEAIRQRGAKR